MESNATQTPHGNGGDVTVQSEPRPAQSQRQREWYIYEIAFVARALAGIPKENVIDRLSWQGRLEQLVQEFTAIYGVQQNVSALDDAEPGGLMACNPELLTEPRPVRWVVRAADGDIEVVYKGRKCTDAIRAFCCASPGVFRTSNRARLVVQGPHEGCPEREVSVEREVVYRIDGLRGNDDDA